MGFILNYLYRIQLSCFDAYKQILFTGVWYGFFSSLFLLKNCMIISDLLLPTCLWLIQIIYGNFNIWSNLLEIIDVSNADFEFDTIFLSCHVN